MWQQLRGLLPAATGSVAANGFGALMTDTVCKTSTRPTFPLDRGGCGSGEVVAHLDTIEPPAGRCERTRTASAN